MELTLELPESCTKLVAGKNELVLVTSGDLRDSANQKCWPVQDEFEQKFSNVMKHTFDYNVIRGHSFDKTRGHGFIASQREGCDVFEGIDENAPVVVLLTAWQYSHHLAPALMTHKGPILVLANFDGTWPGLVGALCLEGTLTSLGREYSRLWSEHLDDEFFLTNMKHWLANKTISHDTSYLKKVQPDNDLLTTPAAQLGKKVGQYILEHKDIMGLFDSFCMGMMNGVFPQKCLVDIGMPMESLSQSALLHEMSLVPQDLREACLSWYEEKGMTFQFGQNEETELTRNQVLEQCAMMIAMARFAERFGLASIGVQYQQGLKDSCAASDFAEGAIGSSLRFPIPDENGQIIRPNKPIPCINEVDMGTAIPQTMLFRLLDSLGLPSETTLHDIRWGSEFEGVFYWDFEISGSVPFEHLRGGISGAQGNRQPAMFFPKGGSTISGQCKAGSFIWARAHYEENTVYMHIGTGEAVELPEQEFQRRLNSTTKEWPLMNCTLDGVSKNDLMAGHQSNHITIAYVDKAHLNTVFEAFVAQSIVQNINVSIANKEFKL
ncbi:hypothetical protein [Vibrio sp. MA40-2]|uniref:hypothetical protein n=1 Tax=Vibrio sp. MA40-2 TaxID=3391828 RepID=UPI0039A630C8